MAFLKRLERICLSHMLNDVGTNEYIVELRFESSLIYDYQKNDCFVIVFSTKNTCIGLC